MHSEELAEVEAMITGQRRDLDALRARLTAADLTPGYLIAAAHPLPPAANQHALNVSAHYGHATDALGEALEQLDHTVRHLRRLLELDTAAR